MAETHTLQLASGSIERYSPSIDKSTIRNRSSPQHMTLPQGDIQFMTLVNAYRGTGGLAWRGDLESMFMLRSTGSAREFSESIAVRQVVHFEWQAQVWLPLFQFDLVRMQTHKVLTTVLDLLNGIYDNWEVADWFSSVNPWLNGRSPAVSLIADPLGVLDAASAEVFVARG